MTVAVDEENPDGDEQLVPVKSEAKKESAKAVTEMQSEPEPEIQPQP